MAAAPAMAAGISQPAENVLNSIAEAIVALLTPQGTADARRDAQIVLDNFQQSPTAVRDCIVILEACSTGGEGGQVSVEFARKNAYLKWFVASTLSTWSQSPEKWAQVSPSERSQVVQGILAAFHQSFAREQPQDEGRFADTKLAQALAYAAAADGQRQAALDAISPWLCEETSCAAGCLVIAAVAEEASYSGDNAPGSGTAATVCTAIQMTHNVILRYQRQNTMVYRSLQRLAIEILTCAGRATDIRVAQAVTREIVMIGGPEGAAALATWERSPGREHYEELLTAACAAVYEALSEADLQKASSAGVCILERHMAKLVEETCAPKLKEGMVRMLQRMFEIAKESWLTNRDKARFANQCELVWIPLASRLLEDKAAAEDEEGSQFGRAAAARWHHLTALMSDGLLEIASMAIQAGLICDNTADGDDESESDSEDDLNDPDDEDGTGGYNDAYEKHFDLYDNHELAFLVMTVQRIGESLPSEAAVMTMVAAAVGPEIQSLGALALVHVVAAQVPEESPWLVQSIQWTQRRDVSPVVQAAAIRAVGSLASAHMPQNKDLLRAAMSAVAEPLCVLRGKVTRNVATAAAAATSLCLWALPEDALQSTTKAITGAICPETIPRSAGSQAIQALVTCLLRKFSNKIGKDESAASLLDHPDWHWRLEALRELASRCSIAHGAHPRRFEACAAMIAGAYGLQKTLRGAVFSIFSQHIFQPCQYHLSTSQSQPHFPIGAIKGCLMLLRSAISTFYSELNMSGLNHIAVIAMDTLETTMTRSTGAIRVMALSVLQEALAQGAGGTSGGEEASGYRMLQRIIAGCATILKSGEKGGTSRQSLRIILEAVILEKWKTLNVDDIRGGLALCLVEYPRTAAANAESLEELARLTLKLNEYRNLFRSEAFAPLAIEAGKEMVKVTERLDITPATRDTFRALIDLLTTSLPHK